MSNGIKINKRPKHVWVHPEFVDFYDKYKNLLDDCLGIKPSFPQFTRVVAKNSRSIIAEIENMKKEKYKTKRILFKKEKSNEIFSKPI